MRDFNLVKAELIQHLKFSTQADNGTIYWYEGTVHLLWEMLAFYIAEVRKHEREKDDKT